MILRNPKLNVSLVVAALALSACGGGGNDTPPAEPTGLFLTPLGISNSPTVFVRGNVEQGAVAEVFLVQCHGNPVVSGRAETFASGGLQVVMPLNATNLIVVRARKGDLTSRCVEAGVFTHDDQPPAKPTLMETEMVSSAPVQVRLRGTAEPRARVRLFPNADCSGDFAEVRAGQDGAFEFQSGAASNATTQFTVLALDDASNLSECSAPRAFVHDSTPPPPPQLTGTNPPSPGKQTQVAVQGTAEPGATVRLFRNAGCTTSATANSATAAANGAFSITVTAYANAPTSVHAQATDSFGNVSACSAALIYVHDSIAPPTPVLGPSTPASPSNATTFDLEIQAEGGTFIQLYGQAGCSGQVAAQGTMPAGGYAVFQDMTVAQNGSRTFSARSTDDAQNVSGCSQPFTFVNDGTPPPPPVLEQMQPASPANTIYPNVAGTAEPGATVRIYRSGDCTGSSSWTGTADGAGIFAVSVTALSNQTSTFSGTAQDGAGNTSGCSTMTLTYTHDSVAPPSPTFATVLPPSPSRMTSATVHGLAEPGATVDVFNGSGCFASTLLGSGPVGPAEPNSPTGRGPFAVTVTLPQDATTYLYARAKDAVGNQSSCTYVGYPWVHNSLVGWEDAQAVAPGEDGYAPSVLASPMGGTVLFARHNGSDTTMMSVDVAAGAFGTPSAFGPAGTHLLDRVRMAQDALGNQYAVWSQYGPGPAFSGEVFASVRPVGGSWSAPFSFGAETHEPDLAAGGTEVVAVFRTQVSATESQVHARRFAAGAWEPQVRVDTGTLPKFAPRVAVTSTGEVLVLYTEQQGSASTPLDVLYSARFTGGTWQAPQLRSTYRIVRGEYDVQASGPGRAVASWLEATSSSTSIYFRPRATRYTTTGFGAATSIGLSTTQGYKLALAANSSDRVMLIASHGAGDALAWSHAANTASGFNSLANLATPAANASSTHFKLAMAPNGLATAVWIAPNRMETGEGLWFSTSQNGGLWQAPQLLELNVDPTDTFDVSVQDDHSLVIWSVTSPTGTRQLRSRAMR